MVVINEKYRGWLASSWDQKSVSEINWEIVTKHSEALCEARVTSQQDMMESVAGGLSASPDHRDQLFGYGGVTASHDFTANQFL